MNRLQMIKARLAETDIRGEPEWHEFGCPHKITGCECVRADVEYLVDLVDRYKGLAQ